jgi:membrane protein YqaA with SNARE-associated domain
VLAAFIAVEPGSWREALALATAGNTAGGMSTYLLGRYGLVCYALLLGLG